MVENQEYVPTICKDRAWTIDSSLDLQSSAAARDEMIAALPEVSSSSPVTLDLTAGNATAPALNLLFAARRSLDRIGAFAAWGPTAASAIGGSVES